MSGFCSRVALLGTSAGLGLKEDLRVANSGRGNYADAVSACAWASSAYRPYFVGYEDAQEMP